MTALEHARERIHQLEEKAYRYGLELADRRLEAFDLAAENEKLRAENTELRKYVENVVGNVLKDLKEHYRKSAIPKWDIQFLEKYAQQNGIEL